MSRCGTAMYMSPEVAERKPYGAASDTYGLGCVLLEMMLRCQLRERRPFEERKDYIQETLNHARGHGWSTFDEMASLAWKMLDESPKSRIGLPQAAAVSAAAVSVLVRQQEAESVANGGVLNNSNAADDGRTRVRQPKLIAAAERTRRPAGPAQRRKLQYAD
jgi:serine/threonine protein kinase